MSLAKSAAKRFINGLLTDGSQINVGLADFSGYNHVSIGLTDVSGKDNLIAGVDSLTSAHSDGTNYGSGLQAANKILESGKNDQKFVVFISDGAPNSDYGPADYTGVGTAASMTGVTIMTVGIGESEASYLQAISSSDKNGSPLYYQSAMTETALNAVLNTLKDTIISTIYAGTNARMTDTINTDAFEFVNADSSLSYDNNGSLTWDIKNIIKDTQSVSFTIKPKEGNTTTGLFYTNTDVSLDFHSSVLDEDVSFTKSAIGEPTVGIYSVTYTDGTGNETIFKNQTTNNLLSGMSTPNYSGGDPERENYTFDGWTPSVDPTIGGSTYEIVYTAKWIPKSYAYTVEYYKDSADDEDNLLGSDTGTGTFGTDIPYTEGKYLPDGYVTPGAVSGQRTITADAEKNVLNVVYKKNTYKLTYVVDGSTYKETTYEFGATLPAAPTPTKTGYTFSGWDKKTPATMPANDLSIKGSFTKNGGYHPRPTTPTVVIPDDDALGLNTTDHFAYIVGYGNGEVRPQNNITRAEVATIFFRLLTDDVRDENLTKTNRYSDVAATSWYNTAVSTLSSMGIITGYPDGTFRPNAAITRAEFAAIAARFDNDGDKTAAKFSDIATHWAKDEISIAYNNGWITGYPNGTFGPQRDITRAETMTLVNRVLNRQPETEDDLLPNMTVWTDNANPKAWYYLAVQEATNSHYYKFKTNSKYEKWTELRETRDWTQLEK